MNIILNKFRTYKFEMKFNTKKMIDEINFENFREN